MAWSDSRFVRGVWLVGLCWVGGALAACGSNPAVNHGNGEVSGGGSSSGATGGSDGSAASANSGNGASANALNVPDGGGDNNTTTIEATALVFEPPSVTLTLDSAGAAKTASYTLKATLPDKTVHDVTAESLDFDRPDLASFVIGPPAVLTATGTMAGTGTLHAVYGGLEAKATLTVNIVESATQGAVDSSITTALNAASLPRDSALGSLLYPYDKTVFPLGLASPLMMWNAPNKAGDVYRVHLEEKGYQYDYYSAVNDPAQLRVPQAAWDRITASNTGDTLALTLSRYDAVAKKAFSSVSESFTIAPESLQGAIYYWTASQIGSTRVGSINRVYPGSGAKPEPLNQGRCMGCHSVSADGSTLVATIEDPSAPSVAPYSNWTKERAWASFSLPAGTLSNQTTKSGANSALTPDGKYVVFGGRADLVNNMFVPGSKYISLATTATGNVIADSGLDDLVLTGSDGVMMPSFSPDGKKLALVEAGGDLSDNVLPTPSVRILYLDFDQASTKFDAANAHEIVKASALPANNNQLGYPSFSPDGSYIAYHSGQYSTGCHDGCVDSSPDAGDLWISPTAGGDPIRLANIDDPPNVADHFTQREPTFCPVSRGGYSWVVFTSMRDWGNVHTGAVINSKRRLWVAAVDQKLGTVDPSHPAFYVEGQDDTPNMRGFWALAQCIATPTPPAKGDMCTAGFQCCSGFCVDGQCVDKSKLACAGVGEACASAGDCCNKAATDCVDNVCRVNDIPK